MKYPILLLTLVLGLAQCTSSQKTYKKAAELSPETNDIVAEIEKVNVVMGSAVYESGVRPQQFDNFVELKKVATKEELETLLIYPNPVVRCYAFWAVQRDTTVDLLPLLIAHVDDTEEIKTQFGCIGGLEKVGDVMINAVVSMNDSSEQGRKNRSKLRQLDSILLFRPNNLATKAWAINRAKPIESNYRRIRQLAIDEHNQEALVKLSEYRKRQDIELILNNAETNGENSDRDFFTYEAIANFPDSAFLPLLKNRLYAIPDGDHYNNVWLQLYRAIASFQNDETAELIAIPLTRFKNSEIRKYHLNYVFSAIGEFNAPIYDNLLWQLWEKDLRINTKTFKYLWKKDSARAIATTYKSLNNLEEFSAANQDFGTFPSEDGQGICSVMLAKMLSEDSTHAKKIISYYIGVADVHIFPIFSSYASKMKNVAFIQPLLERLKMESNPYVYLSATEALLSYHNERINQEIKAAIKSNDNLRKGWGGESLTKLLKENGLN